MQNSKLSNEIDYLKKQMTETIQVASGDLESESTSLLDRYCNLLQTVIREGREDLVPELDQLEYQHAVALVQEQSLRVLEERASDNHFAVVRESSPNFFKTADEASEFSLTQQKELFESGINPYYNGFVIPLLAEKHEHEDILLLDGLRDDTHQWRELAPSHRVLQYMNKSRDYVDFGEKSDGIPCTFVVDTGALGRGGVFI